MSFPPDPPNPWTRHSTRVLYENPWMRLDENKVTGPDGKPYDYTVVHFQNRAVGVVPYERGGIWFVGQTRFALDQYSWELPEGGVPESEDMAEAARRELREETGITAGTLTHLMDIHTSNSVTDEWGQIFLATDLNHGASDLEGTEDITRHFVSVDDAVAAIDAGRITDALTIAGVLRVALMRARGDLSSSGLGTRNLETGA